MIGITGTNGKTTTAYLVESALRALGARTGLIGTVETRIGDERLASVRTTPEAPDLHAILAVMHERGTDSVVMEVSSHALTLGRVDAAAVEMGAGGQPVGREADHRPRAFQETDPCGDRPHRLARHGDRGAALPAQHRDDRQRLFREEAAGQRQADLGRDFPHVRRLQVGRHAVKHPVSAELGAAAARPPDQGQGDRVGALGLGCHEGIQRLAQRAVDGDRLAQVVHEIAQAET